MLLGALALHLWTAAARSRALLEHDESISLLAAAGKSQKINELEGLAKSIAILPAAEIQDWLRPSGTRMSDVRYSLAAHDRHPPLYFLLLHGLQRAGLDSRMFLRLIGTVALFMAGWFAARNIWPKAPLWLGLLAMAWLLASPVSLDVATELRQYGIIHLGVVIAVAAIICHWESLGSRETIFLLVAAPALLLWTQIASIIWVAICLVLLIIPCFSKAPDAGRRVVWALTLSLVVLLPLGIRWFYYPTGMQLSPAMTFHELPSRLFEPLARGIARAWFTHPGRFEFTLIPAMAGALALLIFAFVGLTSRTPVNRALTIASLMWLVAWCILVRSGRLPPQALLSKQLLPVSVCMLAVFVREASSGWNNRNGRIAFVVLALSVLSHPLGVIRLIHGKQSQAGLTTALGQTDALMASAPQRGHFLPLVDVLRPDATVLVGTTSRAVQDWMRVAPVLPQGELVVAFIRSVEGTSAMDELNRRLSQEYSESKVLRDENARKLIAYRHRSPAASKP